MSPRRPDLVVFDLGGVLIRICRSWAEACAAAGLDVRPASTDESASRRRHELARRHGIGQIDSDAYFRLLSESMHGLYTPDEVRRIHDAWLLGEYAGVHELIADIKAAGVATGVLSNTNHAHWVRLVPPSHGGLHEFKAPGLVDRLHASHLLGVAKPDAAIYHAFHRTAGLAVRPDAILFFDDLEENVAAARACGWQAELVDYTGDTAAQMRSFLRARGLWA